MATYLGDIACWRASLSGKMHGLRDSGAGAVVFFDQTSSLKDAEVSGGVQLEYALCKSISSTGPHGQPACWPANTATLQPSWRTSPNAMALPSFPGPYGPEPLPERMSLPAYLSTVFIFPSTYPSIHLSIYPSIHLSIYLSISQSLYLSIFFSLYLSIYLFICHWLWHFVSCWLGVKKLNKRTPATPGELARLWISETLKTQVCVYIFFYRPGPTAHSG